MYPPVRITAAASAMAIGDENVPRIRTLSGISRLSGSPTVGADICIAIHDNAGRDHGTGELTNPSPLFLRAGNKKVRLIFSFSPSPSNQPRMAALGCDFNRSMQHLISNYREEDVENEATTEDLLHRNR